MVLREEQLISPQMVLAQGQLAYLQMVPYLEASMSQMVPFLEVQMVPNVESQMVLHQGHKRVLKRKRKGD